MRMKLSFHALVFFLGAASLGHADDPNNSNNNNNNNKNMNHNGMPYLIANSDAYDTEAMARTMEYFDMYSLPIRSLYSQVHWTSHGEIPLPSAIVERFAHGKVIAITGYEVDQVFLQNDPTTGEEEVSVPITWAYNHHYMAYLYNSQKARLVEKAVTDEDSRHMSHGSDKMWIVESLSSSSEEGDDDNEDEFPQSQYFSEGNGGEMRKSYHGYPKGYAQLIQSPDTFNVIPMQIDTWNRKDMTNATFVPGPLPSSSQIRNGDAGYNPLLECPCTDRLPKHYGMTYTLVGNTNGSGNTAVCQGGIMDNATECFQAASTLIPSTHHTTEIIHDKSLRQGLCTVTLAEDGSMHSVWNSYCSSNITTTEEKTKTKAKITGANSDTTTTTTTNDTKEKIVVVGVAKGVVKITMVMNEKENLVTMTLTGPPDQWFGVGFGTDSMCIHMEADECPTGGPYAIIVQGNHVEERKLDYHGAGRVLNTSIYIEANQVIDDEDDEDDSGSSSMKRRVVKVSRPFHGITSNHYTFDATKDNLKVIMATGCQLELAQHCGHQSNQINFLPVNGTKEICRAGIQGTIGGNPFHNHCLPYPKSVLLEQDNPTCTIQKYQGGQSCCRHDHYLLDQHQDIPWPDQYLEYRLKFRFYFQEYHPQDTNPSNAATAATPSHQNLLRLYWQTEAWASEYDVPQCPPGTPSSQCIHEITSQWQVQDFIKPKVDPKDNPDNVGLELIYAAPHCHAPVCLSMELYNADTGELLCHVEPVSGTGNLDIQYDEAGYLAIPPCLWSANADEYNEGLLPPVFLPLTTTLLSIKRANATFPHTGEMASWQMRGVLVSKTTNQQQPQTNTTPNNNVSPRLRVSLGVNEEEEGN